VKLVLYLFIFAFILRIVFNTCYILLDYEMCKFSTRHEKWFAVMQSSMYLVGEAAPIMVIFGINALEIIR